jgi:glutathione S-transferase
MLELYQTEWCPASRRVREHLTELGVDYLIHQVPVEREARTTLRVTTGGDTIPALLVEDGTAVVGDEAIEAYLAERFDEAPEAEAHRAKAAKARRHYLEEECECSQLIATP